jgi:hypothetical protein
VDPGGILSVCIIKALKECGWAFILLLHYCFYLSQIGRVASCRSEACHKSLAVDPETLPTFCVSIVPVGSVQGKTIINQVWQGGRSSVVAGDILSDFSENLLPFLGGE